MATYYIDLILSVVDFNLLIKCSKPHPTSPLLISSGAWLKVLGKSIGKTLSLG